MEGSKPTLIDKLKTAKLYWSPWSCVEALLVIRICVTYCDGKWPKVCQMLAAYMYIASKRDSRMMTASVIDAEVAENVPRIRKPKDGSFSRNCVGPDAYRKGVKQDLRACGLVDFTSAKSIGSGKVPTVYTFPALEKELSLIAEQRGQDGSGSQNRSANAYSDIPGATTEVNPSISDQVPPFAPVLSEQFPHLTPTSLGTGLHGNNGCTEGGNNTNSGFVLKQAGTQCSACGSYDVEVYDSEHWICNRCTFRFDIDGYAW